MRAQHSPIIVRFVLHQTFHLSYKREIELPATYEIDHKQRLVTSRLWGPVTEDEVFEHNDKLRNDPEFDPSYRQFVDMTGITEIKVGTGMINETSLDQFPSVVRLDGRPTFRISTEKRSEETDCG